jgi:hypothetical protein
MAGSIMIADKDPRTAKEVSNAVVKRAMAIAKERNCKSPKTVGVHGGYGSWIAFSYTSNAFKECLVAATKELGHEVINAPA